ncbi:hypothetical protein [Shewanella sp.]|uniref:hypothetical protein n=1 Tax=Shewanella sp. TaxID=50422 RepID=UPI003F2B61D5
MNDQLLTAIEYGNFTLVKEVLSQQPELVNTVFMDQEVTPFELALKNGFSTLAEYIINSDGFDLDHHDHNL